MNYHDITTDDMNNGDGLRVVLWLAGCEHHCKNCQNPVTWDVNGGLNFTETEKMELEKELSKSYINGITFSGGDPLHPNNRLEVYNLCKWIKEKFADKTIWLYTGYRWEEIKNKSFFRYEFLNYIDVLVDGKYEEFLKDVNYPWAGSLNQRVIDVKESLKEGKVVKYESNKKRWYKREI